MMVDFRYFIIKLCCVKNINVCHREELTHLEMIYRGVVFIVS